MARIDETQEAVRFDNFDYRILTMLKENSRLSCQQIAKVVKLKRDSVAYRIKRLESLGVIDKYTLDCDAKIFGYSKFYVLFQLLQEQTELSDSFYAYLKEHQSVTKLVTFNDKWDLVAIIMVKGIEELDQLITNVHNNFGEIVGDQEILQHVRPLYGKPNATKIPKLDAIDIKILNMLFRNSRRKLVSIGREIGLSSDAVVYRIKKYSSFVNFTIDINVSKLGFHWYTFLLQMNIFNIKDESRLIEFMSQKRFLSATKTLGKWNVVINLLANDMKEFHLLSRQFRGFFSNTVRDFDALMAYQELKNDLLIPNLIYNEKTIG